MTIVVLSNPKNFVIQAHKKNIRYEYLKESIECHGYQKTARMFVGRSSRGEQGTLSAATLLNWIATFEYVLNNRDKDDKDPFFVRTIEKRGDEWDTFVTLIQRRIDDDEVQSWKNLSYKKLGDKAIEIGLTLGVRTTHALPLLFQKMKELVQRRKENIWDKVHDEIETKEKNDYRLKNVFELRDLCKHRGILQSHKTKDEMIRDLETFDKKKKQPIITVEYDNMTLKELKTLAKDRTIAGYNKLNHNALIDIHKRYDEEIENMKKENTNDVVTREQNNDQIIVKEFKLTGLNGETHDLLIRNDGMVNATLLCKAMGRIFYEYERSKQAQVFIEAIKSETEHFRDELIVVKRGGDPKQQGSWVNRLIAIDICRWGCPRFAVQITKWIDELMMTGKVELKRPVKFLIDLKEIDIEAERLELENKFCLNTNNLCLYMAYIGDGLVKIGYSSNYLKREHKHQSSTETEYPQFRLVKTFEISSSHIEVQIHQLLDRYRVSYNKQKEIYRPPSTLTDFISHVATLLEENDLHMQISKYKIENLELKNQLLEFQKENLELRHRLGE